MFTRSELKSLYTSNLLLGFERSIVPPPPNTSIYLSTTRGNDIRIASRSAALPPTHGIGLLIYVPMYDHLRIDTNEIAPPYTFKRTPLFYQSVKVRHEFYSPICGSQFVSPPEIFANKKGRSILLRTDRPNCF